MVTVLPDTVTIIVVGAPVGVSAADATTGDRSTNPAATPTAAEIFPSIFPFKDSSHDEHVRE
ncbi:MULTISPECIES: hypothetical protein [Amycolatopsis]|uniref:Uncharacterized protein n=1 Tax=Amycolatopsis bullii TaxID=941987 RepID=A0ABQ3KMC2_9PSEU|nr:hypothetical protein [Amycolatopsis bullii]GHG29138.1 hypothetical protein GCM10017567_56030 [Amycolatopsis bullii]